MEAHNDTYLALLELKSIYINELQAYDLLRTPIGHLSYFHVHNRTLNNTVNQGEERCVQDDRAYLSFCC